MDTYNLIIFNWIKVQMLKYVPLLKLLMYTHFQEHIFSPKISMHILSFGKYKIGNR